MKQPEGERAREVVVTVDRRAARWLGVLAAAVVVLGLGVWMGLNVSRIDPSAFDPYAASAPSTGQVSVPPDVLASIPQPPATAPVLLPPPRPDFKPEPEDFAVKGDPEAPITIVEYSDYQ